MGNETKYHPELNILKLINRFWEIDIEAGFSHLEVHLFFKLIEINNRLKWKETFRFANSRLESEIGTRAKNLIAARQRLIDFNVVNYEKGNTRNAGTYTFMNVLNASYPTKESNQESNQGYNEKAIRGSLYKTKQNKIKLLREVDKSTLVTPLNGYYEIAFFFWEMFRGNLEDLKISTATIDKAKFNDWVDPIQMLIETDGKTIEEIREVYKFIKEDDFWSMQIRSTAKLRKKDKNGEKYFDILLYQARNGKARKGKTGNRNSIKNEETIRQLAAEIAATQTHFVE